MVFIHGGAFTYGDVKTATGQYMMEQVGMLDFVVHAYYA